MIYKDEDCGDDDNDNHDDNHEDNHDDEYDDKYVFVHPAWPRVPDMFCLPHCLCFNWEVSSPFHFYCNHCHLSFVFMTIVNHNCNHCQCHDHQSQSYIADLTVCVSIERWFVNHHNCYCQSSSLLQISSWSSILILHYQPHRLCFNWAVRTPFHHCHCCQSSLLWPLSRGAGLDWLRFWR